MIKQCRTFLNGTHLSEGDEDLALLASLGLLEPLLAVISLGDGLVGDEPAGLGGIGGGDRLATVPLSGELALLTDAGAARWHGVFVLGGDGGHQQSADDEKLKKLAATKSFYHFSLKSRSQP